MCECLGWHLRGQRAGEGGEELSIFLLLLCVVVVLLLCGVVVLLFCGVVVLLLCGRDRQVETF